MTRQVVSYCIGIWLGGMIAGNIAIGFIFEIKLIPLACMFSLAGSALPLLLLAVIVKELIRSKLELNTKVLILLAFCGFSTFLAIGMLLVL
ncbi:MAG: hypothetical protein R3B47_11860 [Bacteroidia bacterium]